MSSQPLGPYLIAERVGTSVWLAEDTRNGRKVAVKLLTKSLPKEPAKREALLREVRVAAAMYHTFLVPILEIVPEGDNLLMVMEVVEGKALTRMLRGAPLEKPEFFRLAFQLASVLKYLHLKGILHGNLNGDSVLVTAGGHLRLAGLNLANLLRRDKASREYQQRGSDARTVSYLAPEMISTQTIDERSDVFSLGVVLYEMATGKLPFAGNDPADVARAIVDGQPISPRSVHPQIDNAVVGVLGPCLFKDPHKRPKEMRAIVETIEKIDRSAADFAAELDKKVAAPEAAVAEQRRAILFVADVANYDALAAEDPEGASRAAARMQQILGESVYLFDGRILDPFGSRLIAEMPSVESALEAGRKGEFDFSPAQQDAQPLDVRMLLHAGVIEIHDGVPSGAGVEKALGALAHLPANQLFISEEFVKQGRSNVRLRDYGARAGLKLFTIVAPEPAQLAEPEVEPSTAEIEAEIAAEMEAEAALLKAQKGRRNRSIALAAAVALIVIVLGGAALMFIRRGIQTPASTTTVASTAAPSKPTAANPRAIHLAPLTVEGADPALDARGRSVLLASAEILRALPELRIADAPVAGAPSYSASIRAGAAGPEILPTAGVEAGTAVPLLDEASGIRAFVEWVTSTSDVPPRALPSSDVLNAFASAVTADAAGDDAAAAESLRTALQADPTFLAAQLVAMRFFEKSGRIDEAVFAAKQVATLDPSNVVALRTVARAALGAGNLQEAFAFYARILERDPEDVESLNHVARYSVSIADAARFNTALQRLARVSPLRVTSHEPDLLTAGGRIDAAIQRYYTIEEQVPQNTALALKIGRLAVLRHSLEIAELELGKLRQSDPLYGAPLLAAYIAAEKQDRATAVAELDRAFAAASPGDDSWTSAAEVYAILNDTPAVLGALEKAAARKEPTAAYVLSSPLFRYLENEPRFERLRATLTEQQNETRTALAQIR